MCGVVDCGAAAAAADGQKGGRQTRNSGEMWTAVGCGWSGGVFEMLCYFILLRHFRIASHVCVYIINRRTCRGLIFYTHMFVYSSIFVYKTRGFRLNVESTYTIYVYIYEYMCGTYKVFVYDVVVHVHMWCRVRASE